MPKLNILQLRELHRTREGKGRYWPPGRELVSLRALLRRELVVFHRGHGFDLTEAGAAELDAYLKEHPYAFDEQLKRQIEVADRVLQQDSNVLKELAQR